MEWKNSELFGGEKRGGKIYIKALQKQLKRTEDSESRPDLYAGFVRAYTFNAVYAVYCIPSIQFNCEYVYFETFVP